MDFASPFQGVLTQALLSLVLLRFSFSLSLSLSLAFLPSFSLLSFLSFLPSPSCNTTFLGRCTQKESFPTVTVRILCSRDLARICIRANYLSQVRDLPSSNMLETAIFVSAFRSTSQTRSCASDAQVCCVHYLHTPP